MARCQNIITSCAAIKAAVLFGLTLEDCQERHPLVCRSFIGVPHTELLTDHRVIDVIDECVSPQPFDCGYIALSYVWGKVQSLQLRVSNIAELEASHSLRKKRSEVAQTILDAMDLVKAMGERFLWVDYLCIVQDGADEDLQIARMDRVYGAALVTIVAAGGMDADAGLAGVRSGSRLFPQMAAEV